MGMHSSFCLQHPDPAAVLQLEPEEMAGLLLEFWRGLPGKGEELNRKNWLTKNTVMDYPEDIHPTILKTMSAAWSWLEREGLVAHLPEAHYHDTFFVTERGKQIKSRVDFATFRLAGNLPKRLLHPSIAEAVLPVYLRGKYSMAVFEAFRDLEDAVRKAAKATDRDVGVALMRKAFDKTSGGLTDSAANEGERQALSDLFAGAIGSYKNPSSHRRVELEAGEAAEMILLASHLMKIVDDRTKS